MNAIGKTIPIKQRETKKPFHYPECLPNTVRANEHYDDIEHKVAWMMISEGRGTLGCLGHNREELHNLVDIAIKLSYLYGDVWEGMIEKILIHTSRDRKK